VYWPDQTGLKITWRTLFLGSSQHWFTCVRSISLHSTSLRFTSLHCTIAKLPIQVPCYSYHCSSILCVRMPPAPLHVASITESHIIVSYYSGTTPYDPPHLYDLSLWHEQKPTQFLIWKPHYYDQRPPFGVPSWFIFISMCGVVTSLIRPNFHGAIVSRVLY